MKVLLICWEIRGLPRKTMIWAILLVQMGVGLRLPLQYKVQTEEYHIIILLLKINLPEILLLQSSELHLHLALLVRCRIKEQKNAAHLIRNSAILPDAGGL